MTIQPLYDFGYKYRKQLRNQCSQLWRTINKIKFYHIAHIECANYGYLCNSKWEKRILTFILIYDEFDFSQYDPLANINAILEEIAQKNLDIEGIVFKNLYDYREELVAIYQQIKGERLNFRMRRSIANITDPTNNSINEKVARIREAFVTCFDKRLATNYIIHGERGEAKRIHLNRKFVKWE